MSKHKLRWDMLGGRQSTFALDENVKMAFSKKIHRVNERYCNKLRANDINRRINKWLGRDRTIKELCEMAGVPYPKTGVRINEMNRQWSIPPECEVIEHFLNSEGIL